MHFLAHNWSCSNSFCSNFDSKALNTLRLRQNGHHLPDDIFNEFSWIKMYEFWLKFHRSLFPRVQLTIFQYWFRKWLGADQVTSHYLNCWFTMTAYIFEKWWNSNMYQIQTKNSIKIICHDIICEDFKAHLHRINRKYMKLYFRLPVFNHLNLSTLPLLS